MRKVVAGTFVTLDGVMQAPGGPEEDTDGGFQHGGWLVPHFSEELGQNVQEWMDGAEAILLGRRTYEIFNAWWPHQGPEDEMAVRLNNMPKYVASRTLTSLDWQNARLLEGDAADAVARLKADGEGELHIPGSSGLIQSLLNHNLIDEFRMAVFPVVLGAGKRLFGDGAIPATLRLTESRQVGNGIMIAKYEYAGVPEYGLIGN
jgi:dihydrofolate reductase